MELDLLVEQVDVAAAQGDHQIAGLPVGPEEGLGVVEGGGQDVYKRQESHCPGCPALGNRC